MQEKYKNFTEVDFESIRDSIKEHLKSQDVFKDYNFEGSAISTLLDVLAYNTQYNAYYLNMMSSEKFLNRAQKRKSVVEIANNYGYVPYSTKSATSYLSFEIIPEPNHIGNIVLPKNLKFTTSNNGTTYSFLSTSVLSVPFINGKYVVSEYEVKEGKYFKNRFKITDYTKFYTIPNANVDIDRLKVYIKPSESSPDESAIEYYYYESVIDLDSTSRVYFIQETDNQKFEIYFGDGVIGTKPEVSSQVIIEYYITKGDEANGAMNFSLTEDVTGLESISPIVAERATNGAKIETVDSIRLSTKDKQKSQNRAVIDSDFYSKIKTIIPDASDISVWGGETSTPKQYGKVFISIIKDGLQRISSTQKTKLITELKDRYMVMGITPEIVDYDTCNLGINISVRKVKNPTVTDNELISSIKINLINDLLPKLSKFNVDIFESKVEEFINYTDKNILANTSRFILYKDIDKTLLNNLINRIIFPVHIQKKSIKSTLFPMNNMLVDIRDDGFGNISIYNNQTEVLSRIATVDYINGVISIINSISIYPLIFNKGIKIYSTPQESDLLINQNYVLNINQNDIEVKINE